MNKFLPTSDTLIFFVILLFSLIFRITNLDLIEFKTDEAVNLLLSALPTLKHSLASGGTVSSIGILNPPLFNYILTPITFFTLDPKVFSFLIALINSFSIAFFYLTIKKYYGQIIAFTSSMLFALSPWAILYSRKIWNQDLLVPFFILMFYSFHKIIRDKKQIFWLPFTLSSVFLVQLHQASIFFISIVFIFMLLQKAKINFKYLLIGAILGMVPLIPYLSYEVKFGYPDFKALFSSQQRLNSNRSVEYFLRPLQITSQGNFSFILGKDLETFTRKFPIVNSFKKLFYIEYILIVIGAFIFIKRFKTYRALAYSAILLPLIYFILKIEPFMHYYIIVLPLLFLFIGMAFESMLQKNKVFKVISLLLFIGLTMNSLAFDFSFFKLLRDQERFQGDYGDSLRNSENHIRYKTYNELFLVQFIPLNYSFGYNPFARIVYKDTSSERIPLLEKNLDKSNDPRIAQEILAFYTKEPPTLETIDTLRKKTRENSGYINIYKETLNDYLVKNYKKEWISERFDLKFFYPSHWKVSGDEEKLLIKGDYIYIEITKKETPINKDSLHKESTVQILGQDFKKIECIKNFCGQSYFGQLIILQINVSPLNFSPEKIEFDLKSAEEVIKSFRFNN